MVNCSDCYDPKKRCPRVCPPPINKKGWNGHDYIPHYIFNIKLWGGKKTAYVVENYRIIFNVKRYKCTSAKAEKGKYLDVKIPMNAGDYYINSPKTCYGIKVRVSEIRPRVSPYF
jgi:hypothetical protein